MERLASCSYKQRPRARTGVDTSRLPGQVVPAAADSPSVQVTLHGLGLGNGAVAPPKSCVWGVSPGSGQRRWPQAGTTHVPKLPPRPPRLLPLAQMLWSPLPLTGI